MDSRNPDELISEVKEQRQTRGELASKTLQWFLDDNVGELFPLDSVVNKLCQELNITQKEANRAISDTVGDIVDPVQQVVSQSKKYVGIIEYSVYEDEGAYRYIDYDDVLGKRKRVVCAKCVEESDVDANVTHATEGEGSTSDNVPWDVLLNKVITHYESAHTTSPQTVTPGASLLNGTTISGNTSFHAGNESTITASQAQLNPNSLQASNGIINATYATVSDTPINPPEGAQFYIQENNRLHVLRGNKLEQVGYNILSLDEFELRDVSFVVSTSVSDNNANSSGIAFKPDGTKMFVSGINGQTITQYSLSTPFDVSTSQIDNSFVFPTNRSIQSIAFNQDGTLLFVLDSNEDSVLQLSLSGAFDIATASYGSVNLDVSGLTGDSIPTGVAFNSDGTIMFIVGTENDNVYEILLNTGFDINSTPSAGANFNVANQMALPNSINFSPDGTSMFISGRNNEAIFQYSLNTSFDISTASFTGNSFNTIPQTGNPRGVSLNPNGTLMFVVGEDSNEVYEYTVGKTVQR